MKGCLFCAVKALLAAAAAAACFAAFERDVQKARAYYRSCGKGPFHAGLSCPMGASADLVTRIHYGV
jgi:hypothetical protein